MRKTLDLTNKIFGNLLVLSRDETKKNNKNGIYWICSCKCGNTKSIRSDCLRKRNFTHCGCESSPVKIGDKYSLLTVIDRADKTDKNSKWKCICECGNISYVRTFSLTRGEVKSCGCLVSKFERKKNPTKIGNIRPYFWARIVNNAKIRKINFDLLPMDGWNLWIKQNGRCAITNMIITLPEKSRDKKNATASLDRIDSSKGYEIDNVQWVHKDINIMKHTFSMEYFKSLCKLVTENCN